MRAVREHDVLSFSGDSHRSSHEQQRFPIAPALTAVSKTASAISAAAFAFLLAAWLPIAAQAQADNTPPSIPTGLAGTAVSPTQINLSWNPSTDNVAVAGYYVYVNDQWQTPLGPTTATSFQHTGRSPNTTYNYRVSSFDTSSNDSAWTATPVAVTTPAADTQAPSVPTDLVATAVSPTQINLSWNPSTDNVAVAGYYVYVNDEWQTPLGPTTATSFQHTGRSPGTTYNYRVSSFDTSSNDSAWTATPVSVTTPATQARDPLKWPFASTSIWNMPIGSDAQYEDAKIPAIFEDPNTPADDRLWASMPSVDWDIIVLTPIAPLTNIVRNNVGWNPGDRCATNNPGDLLFRLPMPGNFVVPHGPGNNSAAFLKPDGRTLIQTQPFTRCVRDQPGTTLTDRFLFPPVDLYGDGIKGSHGGSGLSAIGGSLRIGELRPGSPEGPRHALKLNVYSALILFDCSDSVSQSDCYRWPADRADSHAAVTYGSRRAGNSSQMKMGALLAIPAWVELSTMGLESDPGKQLAWTLQNYGAYINDTQEEQAFTFDAESGPDSNGFFTSFRAQFRADYPELNPINPSEPDSAPLEQRARDNTPWSRDMQRLMTALHVVTNNTPSSIGGGGTPRQPLAPPLALTRFDQDGKFGPPGATVNASPASAWTPWGAEVAAFNDGTATRSDVAGATVTFTFTGTGVSWIGLKCNVCGIASVSVDGGAAAPVDTNGPAAPGDPDLWSEAVFTASGLAAATHTLVITVEGRTTSSGAHIVVDAFDVIP